MKELIDYEIKKESWEKQYNSGRYNPALEIHYTINEKQHINTLSAGYSDDITVFYDNEYVYVLSINKGLMYAGLEEFKQGEIYGNVYMDEFNLKESDIDIDNMKDLEIVNILTSYI